MYNSTTWTIQDKEDMDSFWSEMTSRVGSSSLVDDVCFLISLFADILNLPPQFLCLSEDGSGKLTAIFPFEFSQWKAREGSLLVRFRWDDRITGAWMMISDFPPAENPVYEEIARYDDTSNAYLTVLPELYSKAPLVYNETMAFAPWIRILIDPSISFISRRKQLTNYIQFAAQYNTDLSHFIGTEITRNQQKDFMIFGYLPQQATRYGNAFLEARLLSHPQYLRLVVDTGMIMAPLGGIKKILPEIPEGEDPQQYVTICALAGQVFARLESEWEIIVHDPYLLVTLENMLPDQLLASDENIVRLQQVFSPLRYYLPNPDLL